MDVWGIPDVVFLPLYGAALASLAATVYIQRRRLGRKDAGDERYRPDRYEAALLAGGEPYVIAEAVSALSDLGVVSIESGGHIRLAGGPVPFELHPVEATVAAALSSGPAAAEELRGLAAVSPVFVDQRLRLEAAGLLPDDRLLSGLQRPWPLALGLLAIGALRYAAVPRSYDEGLLTWLVLAALGLLCWIVVVPEGLSASAEAALERRFGTDDDATA